MTRPMAAPESPPEDTQEGRTPDLAFTVRPQVLSGAMSMAQKNLPQQSENLLIGAYQTPEDSGGLIPEDYPYEGPYGIVSGEGFGRNSRLVIFPAESVEENGLFITKEPSKITGVASSSGLPITLEYYHSDEEILVKHGDAEYPIAQRLWYEEGDEDMSFGSFDDQFNGSEPGFSEELPEGFGEAAKTIGDLATGTASSRSADLIFFPGRSEAVTQEIASYLSVSALVKGPAVFTEDDLESAGWQGPGQPSGILRWEAPEEHLQTIGEVTSAQSDAEEADLMRPIYRVSPPLGGDRSIQVVFEAETTGQTPMRVFAQMNLTDSHQSLKSWVESPEEDIFSEEGSRVWATFRSAPFLQELSRQWAAYPSTMLEMRRTDTGEIRVQPSGEEQAHGEISAESGPSEIESFLVHPEFRRRFERLLDGAQSAQVRSFPGPEGSEIADGLIICPVPEGATGRDFAEESPDRYIIASWN